MHPSIAYTIFSVLYAIAFSFESASYTPFMHEIGMNFTQIEIANTTFIVTQLLAEIPTGLLADRQGRRWSLLAGALVSGVGFALYATATGFAMSLLSEAVIGIGFAFVSGCAQAWVTDALIARGAQGTTRRTFARADTFRSGGSLLAGIVGAMIGDALGLRVPWILSAGSMFLLFLFVWHFMSEEGEPKERMNEAEALRASWKILKTDSALVWVLLVIMASGLAGSINHLWHPYFLEHLSQSGLGLVWAVVCAGSMTGTFLASRLTDKPRQEITFSILALATIGMSFFGLAATHSLFVALIWIFIHNIARNGIVPILNAYIQHRIQSGNRATFGSLVSVVRHIGFGTSFMANALFTLGLAYGAETTRVAWSLMAPTILVATGVLFLFRPKDA